MKPARYKRKFAEPNTYRVEGRVAYLTIRRQSGEVTIAFDTADLATVQSRVWYYFPSQDGAAKIMSMRPNHRRLITILVPLPRKLVATPIDGDFRNCRRSNLRIESVAAPIMRATRAKVQARPDRYIRQMNFRGQAKYAVNLWIGLYHTKAEARKARDAAIEKLSLAIKQNIPPGD